jgi:hypothetical protein
MRLSMLLPMTAGDRAWLLALQHRDPKQGERAEVHMPETRDDDLAWEVAAQFVVTPGGEA